jgi:rhodanese-related sulfurtransferase
MNSISTQELKQLIANQSNIELLDVREPDERAEFNIGGHFLPLGKIMAFQFDEIEDLKDKEIFVYCRSGKRSMQACMFLEQAGFMRVTNVEGGILAWQAMES